MSYSSLRNNSIESSGQHGRASRWNYGQSTLHGGVGYTTQAAPVTSPMSNSIYKLADEGSQSNMQSKNTAASMITVDVTQKPSTLYFMKQQQKQGLASSSSNRQGSVSSQLRWVQKAMPILISRLWNQACLQNVNSCKLNSRQRPIPVKLARRSVIYYKLSLITL